MATFWESLLHGTQPACWPELSEIEQEDQAKHNKKTEGLLIKDRSLSQAPLMQMV